MAQATSESLEIMQKARLAIQNLACVPQAQRRYIQMGWMPNAIVNLDNAVENLDSLIGDELVTPEQADKMRELHRLVHHGLDTHEDFLEEKISGPREFLLGHALENDDWEAIRQVARNLFGDVAGEDSVFIAINAK